MTLPQLPQIVDCLDGVRCSNGRNTGGGGGAKTENSEKRTGPMNNRTQFIKYDAVFVVISSQPPPVLDHFHTLRNSETR
jgi:hypothetical protein